MSIQREIRLRESGDGTWTATDVTRGISAKGPSRSTALDALDDLTESDSDAEELAPFGDRLRGMAGDLDLDAVEEVRDVRERI